ncbi:putative DNA protecting protein DprA [Magnetofaba australis IT-1]|uniref:Putative DNA protecting protein DprA n=2 Tax=Magnetofaba TaxID=1472292 RepID=A0A1Y2K0W5_9PROT|nr:DNA-processing protein DprA [Magnetofaba australis]OSM00393.1 putative DNA protecting protein DprA [Magnetofaba australis IT-1]
MAILDAWPELLLGRGGLKPQAAKKLGHVADETSVIAELDRLKAMNVRLIGIGSPDYPPQLAQIHDPPPVLFAQGDITQLHGENLVAMVGTRAASQNGLRQARRLAGEMAQADLITVSGLALGIDAAAHAGALDNGGGTVAVVATGLDVDYPKPNRKLKQRIIQHGCLISELPLGSQPHPGGFPRRNRIISGLSRGVVVVEAAVKSGSLITARTALEQGRDVYAMPGPVGDYRAEGVNRLIKDGARLVESAQDVLEELQWSLGRTPVAPPPAPVMPQLPLMQESAPSAPAPPVAQKSATPAPVHDDSTEQSSDKQTLLKLLAGGRLHVDELTRNAHLSAAEMASTLLQLELESRIQRCPGNFIELLKS